MDRPPPDVGFSRVESRKLYETVVLQIKAMIDHGYLKPGDILPSERDMTQRLGVSRGILCQAFRVLEEEGLLEVRSGSGRMVRAPRLGASETRQVVDDLENAAILDLLEARDALESGIVRLACDRISSLVSLRLASILQRCETNSLDTRLDEEFHLALAESTQNVVLANMLRLSLGLLRKTRERTLQLPGSRQAMAEEHAAIYIAVSRRDKEAASLAILDHLNGIRLRLSMDRDETKKGSPEA